MIVVAGEALIDLVAVDRDGGYRAVPGGSPANTAVAVARLGQPTAMLARLGRDAFARQLRAHLLANGVDLSLTVPATEPTTLAVATLDEAGVATYDFYLAGTADWQWRSDELPAEFAPDVVAVHTGSLALAVPPGAAVLADLLAREHERRALTVSVDVNLRPTIHPDRDAAARRVARQVPLAHLVKASDEDLGWLYPGEPVPAVAARWQAAGACAAVVTLGGQGAYLLDPAGREYRVPAPPVDVVDTVGAGDSFTGGLLTALAGLDALGSDPAGRLSGLSADRWRAVLEFAVAVSALTCTRRGADPPRRDEVPPPPR